MCALLPERLGRRPPILPPHPSAGTPLTQHPINRHTLRFQILLNSADDRQARLGRERLAVAPLPRERVGLDLARVGPRELPHESVLDDAVAQLVGVLRYAFEVPIVASDRLGARDAYLAALQVVGGAFYWLEYSSAKGG